MRLSLLRATLSAVAISFLVSAFSLYVFDIQQLRRLELLILALSLPAVISPLIAWQHARRGVLLEELQEELKKLNRYDELTGLLTRRSFLEAAHKELLLASRHGYAVSLVSLAIDDFEELKKRYAQQMASQAFRACAKVLKEGLRETDTLARYGEDSFMVLMPYTEVEQAREVASRLQEQLYLSPLKIEWEDIKLSISIGISHSAEGNYDAKQLSEHSEFALTNARSKGKNQILIFQKPSTVSLPHSED